MTEDQKQALIEWLKEGIELREEYGFNGNLLASMRVALAALTAPEDWKQRAEAAEAKLAELEKQEPVAWHIYQWRESPKGWDWYLTRAFASEPNNSDGWRSVALFTRPAPAAGLAELVPDKWSLEQALKFVEDYTPPSEEESVLFAVNSFRAAILRNIEEAK